MSLRSGLLALAAVCLTHSAPRADEGGYEPLFDGMTLRGWAVIAGPADSWKVEDGLLVCEGAGGGWLGTKRDYANFALKLEFRLSPESNSGVYLRAPADASHVSRTGMEIQLLDETHPRYRDIKDWQKTGALYHVRGPEPGHLKPTGEWNALEVTCRGPWVAVRLNGATVVEDRIDRHPDLDAEHPGLKRPAGRIGLQSHNGRVEFRAIAVREWKAPSP